MQPKLTSQDSGDSPYSKNYRKMKISIYTKSFITKASSFVLLFSLVASIPTEANAGFFNDLLTNFVSPKTQAADDPNNNSDFGTDYFPDNSQNSQNMPLLESSIDPDMKNADNAPSATIVSGDALSPDTGLVGIGLESVSNGEMTTYIVQEGDTLSEIAQQFDISTNTIKWANNITGNTIKVGQKLDILPVTGVKHIIKSGDTLDKIATKYEALAEDIMVFNGITRSSVLKTGDILYVPNGIMKATVVTSKTSTGKTTTTATSNVKVESGYYLRPMSGPVTSPYGSRRGGFHYGIDIGARRGTTVLAAASGTVVGTVGSCVEGRTSCGGRYGNYIVIQHSNGTFTRYAHLSKVSVNVGETVSRGEKIGTSGNTGHSTGPHLHFQIEKANGATIRPTF